jgi:hypothetical protein
LVADRTDCLLGLMLKTIADNGSEPVHCQPYLRVPVPQDAAAYFQRIWTGLK